MVRTRAASADDTSANSMSNAAKARRQTGSCLAVRPLPWFFISSRTILSVEPREDTAVSVPISGGSSGHHLAVFDSSWRVAPTLFAFSVVDDHDPVLVGDQSVTGPDQTFTTSPG